MNKRRRYKAKARRRVRALERRLRIAMGLIKAGLWRSLDAPSRPWLSLNNR